jgi:phage/plasmid primase-like uncharacterized protein
MLPHYGNEKKDGMPAGSNKNQLKGNERRNKIQLRGNDRRHKNQPSQDRCQSNGNERRNDGKA